MLRRRRIHVASILPGSKMNKREIVLIIEYAVRTGQAGTTR